MVTANIIVVAVSLILWKDITKKRIEKYQYGGTYMKQILLLEDD